MRTGIVDQDVETSLVLLDLLGGWEKLVVVLGTRCRPGPARGRSRTFFHRARALGPSQTGGRRGTILGVTVMEAGCLVKRFSDVTALDGLDPHLP